MALDRQIEVIHAKRFSQIQAGLGSDVARFEAGPAPSKLATSLTLAAMSLGYGVVQLDVTIVNTALNAIGTSLGGGVAELQWVVAPTPSLLRPSS
jgi:DHA2 family methylenomycin A resistance protein-like MFS transporter